MLFTVSIMPDNAINTLSAIVMCLTVEARLSSNALVSINVAAVRWARLILGWVTVYGRVNHLGMKPGS